MASQRRLGSLAAHVAAEPSPSAAPSAETLAHFRRFGWCPLPGLLDSGQVGRLQENFQREQPGAIATAAELAGQDVAGDGAPPLYYDIPGAIETDEVYLELLDCERVALLLQQ